MNKRCFNTQEAQNYLGIKRRFFEMHIMPFLNGIRAGTSVVFEREDLDSAWEKYKLGDDNERCNTNGGILCDAQKAERLASTTPRTAMKLTSAIKAQGFDSVASKILTKRKAG